MIKDRATNIADNIHGIITISEYEKKIISTTIFNRLHGIYQNSTAYLTFPANRTKRFEHSLGTMFLCSKMFFYSFSNADDEVLVSFFNKARNHVENIFSKINNNVQYKTKLGDRFKKINKLKNSIYISGGIYNYFLPPNIKLEDRLLYCIFFEAVRISALLHDVGHPPFSHITEEALSSIYKNVIKGKDKNRRTKEFISIVKPFFEGDAQLHEEMGITLAKTLTITAIKDIGTNTDDTIYKKQLFEILVREVVIGILIEENNLLIDLHNIIDGTLDGDRLDYITRDSLNSGLDVGRIEYERLINCMKLCEIKDRYMFCTSIKVLNTLDNYLQRRFDIYKNIIFHHRVVKTDYLLQSSICELSMAYLENDGEDEESTESILPYNISGIWKALTRQISELEYSNSLIQWDDSWLITILKKHYFQEHDGKNSVLSFKLKEFLTNEKSYISIIKKKEDFGSIDYEVAKTLLVSFNQISKIQESLKEKSEKLTSSDKKMNIDEYFMQLDSMKERIEKYLKKGHPTDIEGYILPRISSDLCVEEINPFSTIMDKALDTIKNNSTFPFEDAIFIHKNLKPGLTKSLYLWKKTASEDEYILYNDASNIPNILKCDIYFHQCFYIYVLKKEECAYTLEEYTSYRKEIGKIIGEKIAEDIIEQLEKF